MGAARRARTESAADAGRPGAAVSGLPRAGPPGHRHQAPEPIHEPMIPEPASSGQVVPLRRSGQWRKWRTPGDEHRGARRVDGGDDLGVAHRAAGLDERGHAGLEADVRRRPGTGRTRPRRRPAPASARRPQIARAFSTAWRAASTRLVWPEPRPISRPSRTSTIAFEVDAADEPPGEVEVAPLARPSGARRLTTCQLGRIVGRSCRAPSTSTAPPAVRIDAERVRRGGRAAVRAPAPGRRRAAGSASPRGSRGRSSSKPGRDDDLEERSASALGRRARRPAGSARRRRRTPRPGRRRAPRPTPRGASPARRRRTGSCA